MTLGQPTTAESLRAARDLIADPDRWTQGSFARDTNGDPVGSLSPVACRWCLHGALTKVGARYPVDTYLHRVLPKDIDDVALYNDSRQHRTIIRLLNRAIELAEAESA